MRSRLLGLAFKVFPNLPHSTFFSRTVAHDHLTGIFPFLPRPAPSYKYLLTILKVHRIGLPPHSCSSLGTLSCLVACLILFFFENFSRSSFSLHEASLTPRVLKDLCPLLVAGILCGPLIWGLTSHCPVPSPRWEVLTLPINCKQLGSSAQSYS